MNKKISKFDRPFLEAPITVRVVFSKKGDLQYFSHLDLQRTWQKVLVRASIPMWYTQGFNPHSKIVFGIPLPVGAESECEMVDLRIDRLISCEEIKAQLNAELTDEMQVSEVYVPSTKYADITHAEYEIHIHTNASSEVGAEALADEMNKIFASDAEPIIMTKKSKSGDKEVDILPLIKTFDAKTDGGDIVVKTVLAAGSTENLNAEFLIGAMRSKLSVPFMKADARPEEEWYSIMRLGYFTADGERFK